jgi:hypothetical protein
MIIRRLSMMVNTLNYDDSHIYYVAKNKGVTAIESRGAIRRLVI